MIPSSDWRKDLNIEDFQWMASRPEASFYDIWEETINPEGLIYLAKAGGTTQKSFIITACAVARLCLHLVPEGEERPRVAIETAEAWVRGKATAEQVSRAVDAAYAARAVNSAANSAANSAIRTITDVHVDTYTTNTYASAYTSNVVYHTLRAGIDSRIVCATIRKHLPFERPPKLKRLTIWQRLAEGGDE